MSLTSAFRRAAMVMLTGLALAHANAAELATYVPSGGKASAGPIAAEMVAPNINASTIGNIDAVIPNGLWLSSGLSGPVRDSCGPWKLDSGGWLFVKSDSDADESTPSSKTDYFSFSLSTKSKQNLKPTKLCFEYGVGQNSDIPPENGNFYYAVFVSLNGGAFKQVGPTFDSGKLTLKPNVSTLLGTQEIDLSKLDPAQTIEFRVWVGSTKLSQSVASIFQNITVHGATNS